ncbi:hypothetical protein EJB05_14757, partial [Eragrostis curvula]
MRQLSQHHHRGLSRRPAIRRQRSPGCRWQSGTAPVHEAATTEVDCVDLARTTTTAGRHPACPVPRPTITGRRKSNTRAQFSFGVTSQQFRLLDSFSAFIPVGEVRVSAANRIDMNNNECVAPVL